MLLNRREFSSLNCPGMGNFPAFSGQKEGRNNPDKTNVPDTGPIVRGRYFIVERQSGGTLGALRERFLKEVYGTDRSTWFGLYRDDGKIDDYTFIQCVKRGNFRLHPIGPPGLSEGCITLVHPIQFSYLLDMQLKYGSTLNIPGSHLKAYGTG
jgi:hypothetical protein